MRVRAYVWNSEAFGQPPSCHPGSQIYCVPTSQALELSDVTLAKVIQAEIIEAKAALGVNREE